MSGVFLFFHFIKLERNFRKTYFKRDLAEPRNVSKDYSRVIAEIVAAKLAEKAHIAKSPMYTRA